MIKEKNIWLLTEERPKREVIKNILLMFMKDRKIACFIDTIRILPILEKGKFTFLYEVTGFRCNKVNRVFIKSVSGFSSFVDFLIFYQKKQPTQKDTPIYAIEETKTDDGESRNTGVYQRASRFIFIEKYYPKIKKVMLYHLQIPQQKYPTDTYIFGTKLLRTIGVKIEGKKLCKNTFKPFNSIDEIIAFKQKMSLPPKNNVPILIKKNKDNITISGRLIKSNRLAHDPNIGALSLISAAIRKLGWCGKIIITKHGLKQEHINKNNKFIKIAQSLNLRLQGLKLPPTAIQDKYWQYETTGEKLGTIFIHIVVENFTNGFSIFENHAGCEKGYFITKKGEPVQLEKYTNRQAYKQGDKSQIIHIPDLILIDCAKNEIINIEGKKHQFMQNGIEELKNFDSLEKYYIKKYYPKHKIIRTVVLYGSTATQILEVKVGFLLNKDGVLILGIKAPNIFRCAIKNLVDFWH